MSLFTAPVAANLDESAILLQALRNGEDGVRAFDQPSDIAITPDGSRLFAITGENSIVVFNAASDGLWTYRGFSKAEFVLDNLTRLEDVVVSPDGQTIYVIGSGGGFDLPLPIFVFRIDEANDFVELVEVFQEPDVFVGLSEAVISPDGAHLYVSAKFGDTATDGIAIFDIDPEDGTLSFNGSFIGFPQGAHRLAMTPDGHFVIAESTSLTLLNPPEIPFFELLLLRRTPETGRLNEVDTRSIAGEIADFVVGPNSQTVHISHQINAVEGGIAQYITTYQILTDPANFQSMGTINVADTSLALNQLVLSADGTQLTAAGDAFAFFNRDATSGQLQFNPTLSDQINGLSDLQISDASELLLTHSDQVLTLVDRTNDALISLGSPLFNSLLDNGDFEEANAWSFSGGNDDGIITFAGAQSGDQLYLLTGENALEFITQTASGQNIMADRTVTLRFYLAARDLPEEGQIGSRLVLRDDQGNSAVQTCEFMGPRGSFTWTLVECNISTGQAFDSVQVIVGWQDVPSGQMGIDALSLTID
ncbi:MAG: lactonase family protein [Chloroflexi bacterium]|nr:lactonase family protein [Chloroflexota bacterium]